MTCCVPGSLAYVDNDPGAIENDDAALNALSRKFGDGMAQLEFAVPDAHCAACIRTIETALAELPAVKSARVNLTKRRVRIVYDTNGLPSRFCSTAAPCPPVIASITSFCCGVCGRQHHAVLGFDLVRSQ